MLEKFLKQLQIVFFGLSILGIILIVTGMTINDDMFWSITDPITIGIFVGTTVVFYLGIRKRPIIL
ncbi:MAG: hypothetical protein IS860_06175 [Nitrosopumilus sp.]|nr:hypothetical protein [Nitrosopumilus sp.]